jgi:pimeloyl-ACP methyl ester carboxylesterase
VNTPGPERFVIDVSDSVLDDLTRRLEATRLAPAQRGDGWRLGVDADYLGDLVAHWRSGYDWRSHESSMNTWPHHRIELDGVPLHFLHAPGRGPAPMPLILTHGWPWTFWDYHKVLGPLSDPAAHGGDARDAFDVVVPSLPGFTFSTPLPRPGVSFQTTADLWLRLMVDVLGYEGFAAHASDWGMFVTAQLGHVAAERLIGIHLTGTPRLDGWNTTSDYQPWLDYLAGVRAVAGPAPRNRLVEWTRRRAGDLAVHMTDPQSLAHALHDSPAGLASWLVQRRFAWSDCHGDVESRFSKDELLTTVMLYWVTASAASSMRYYYEAVESTWRPAHDRRPMVECPAGFTFFAPDRPPGVAVDVEALGATFDVRSVREHPTGGHFAPMEEPDVLVTDVRDFFRPLRR